MTMPTTINVQVNSDVLLEELDGEAVLLSTKNEHYFGLDEIGLRFWKLLDELKNPTLVVQALLAEYDVDENTVKEDLESFILKLEQADLIEVSSE